MLLRLKIYRFLLKVTIFLMPFFAFEIGWQIWAYSFMFINRPVKYSHEGHFTLVLFSSFLWAFMAEHYKVTKVDELFRERTGARAASAASVATAVILLWVLYFGHNAVFPRGLFVSCLITLLLLTLLSHAAFRFLCRRERQLGRPTRLLIVGADQFAHDAAVRLQRLSFAPSQLVAYVRLPDQEVSVPGTRVFDLQPLNELHS